MAFYPKIDSPCPYRSQLASIMDGDVCSMCQRQVFDLTRMDEHARKSFFRSCSGEVCVSYAVPFRPVLAAAAMMAAVALPAMASAQDVAAVNVDTVNVDAEDMMIIVGGIRDPKNVSHDEDVADRDVPELPVTYEDETGSSQPAEAGKKDSDGISRPAGA
jgi:hypothetical protein